MATKPGLFGLSKNNSNKDFSKQASWGKNQFNNVFPVSLACYMHKTGLDPVYLTLNKNLEIAKSKISVKEIFGMEPFSKNLFFAFESDFTPYRTMVENSLARIDLVSQNKEQHGCLRPIEIKLTALPDNTTVDLSEEKFGSEIVVRPDTMLYLSLSIAKIFNRRTSKVKEYFDPVFARKNIDWLEIKEVRPLIDDLKLAVNSLLEENSTFQSPFMMQPVWKTKGKKILLSDNCLDIFVWSDFAFTRLFVDTAGNNRKNINRRMRSIVWLSKMLHEYSTNGKINYREIIDTYTYDTKNDKAFAVSGTLTNRYMRCDELTKPRVNKNEIKNIILGGGQNFLSPERRLDAAILYTPGLFD